MDNEFVLEIDGVEYHFKLKSQKIIGLEKLYGKNIFQIVQDLSFSVIADFLSSALISPTGIGKFELMDKLLEHYSVQEISENILLPVAVKSGLIKQSDVDNAEENAAKN